MKLKEAIIKGFKRAALSGRTNFHFTFTSAIHFLLGSNGSGKSSIQSYLAVRLPDANDFHVGGSWSIRFEDARIRYDLGAEFTKQGTKHWFNVGEECLNEGGTGTVQKQLIERHFGMKVQILELLTDNTPFTQMSVVKRRELFTLLNPTSMTYVQSLYQELKKELSATTNVLSYTRKRLATEQEGLFDSKLLEEYETQLEEFEAQLRVLYAQQQDVVRPEGFGDYLTELEDMLERILSPSTTEVITEAKEYGGVDALKSDLVEARSRLTFLERNFPQLAQNVKELSERLQAIRGKMGVEALQERRNIHQRDLDALMNGSYYRIIPESINATKTMYEALSDNEMRIIEQLSVLSKLHQTGRVFGTNELVSAEQELNVARNACVDLKNYIKTQQHSLEHVRGVETVECPECKSSFKPGIRPNDVKRVEEDLVRAAEHLKALEAELLLKEESYALQSEFNQSLGSLRQIAGRELLLRPWFDALMDLGFPQQGASAGIQLIEGWKLCCEARYRAGEIRSIIAHIDEQISSARVGGGESQVVLEQQYSSLSTQLEEMTTEITSTREQISRITSLLQRLDQTGCQSWEEGWTQEFWSRYQHEVEFIRQTHIRSAIATLQSQVGLLSGKIRNRAVAQGLVVDLQSQIAQLELEQQELKLLVDELSPTNGLIAEQMSGFVAMFAAKLNQVLQTIWSYPIRVLPCGLEDGDLNYLFPVEQFESQYVSRDVSKCSEGQQDIINFAFKLALVEYLNHPEWPMWLDELGGSFDEHHRVKLVEYIKSLVDSQRVPQIFWISHYASTHSSLVDAEVFVVCKDNILAPKDHSKHVVAS